MRKLLSISLVLILAFSLTACGNIKEDVINISDMTKSVDKEKVEKTYVNDFEKNKANAKTNLVLTKKYRTCIEKAESGDASNNCLDTYIKKALESGLSVHKEDFGMKFNDKSWQKEKSTILKDQDRMIRYLECYSVAENSIKAIECVSVR